MDFRELGNAFVLADVIDVLVDFTSGITAAAPAFCRSLATFKSGFIYGRTTNPSFAKISVAFIVS